ncbi:WD40-repeat-containing domain protein [Lipomyces japonicus]|uniref:WD40-repeat-containing domain protein n=1 Tax=Lipomyces japonicus TaxID=56871 RepID=UPI0034CF34E5
MSDPYFSRKRKRGPAKNGRGTAAPATSGGGSGRRRGAASSTSNANNGNANIVDDEEITDPESSDEEGRGGKNAGNDSDEELGHDGQESSSEEEKEEEEDDAVDPNESAADKRRRLAQQYIENLQQEIDAQGFDAADVDRDILAARLKDDVAADHGRLYRLIARNFSYVKPERKFLSYKNMASPNAIASAENNEIDDQSVFVIGKDKVLSKFNARTGKRLRYKFGGHDKEPLAIAVSSDGKIIATAGKDNKVVAYAASDLEILKTFTQHRGAVQCLTFRRGTHNLYSGSADRTVKSWSLDALTYLETLFGHQDAISGISALAQERCITTGSRDRTARLWKIVEESQLIFRGGSQKGKTHEGSIDCVEMVDNHIFLTGSDNGSISLWTLQKKKPTFTFTLAHGIDTQLAHARYSAELENIPAGPEPQPRWITCLKAIPYSDLFVSGSWNSIKIWRLIAEDEERVNEKGEVIGTRKKYGIEPISEYKLAGVVNDITIVEDGDVLRVCAAVGKEIKGGRWIHKNAKNGVHVLSFKRRDDVTVSNVKTL